jgi:hypothetical protein
MPYVQQLMILLLKSTQNLGGYNRVYTEKERFGRGSLDADPKGNDGCGGVQTHLALGLGPKKYL